MLGLSVPASALAFLVLVTPICFWVAYTDLKYMKIFNVAVIALIAVFAVAGPFLLPLDVYAWRWINLVVVLAIGVLLNATAGVGMGDVKFAAAAAPFFSTATSHVQLMVLLLAGSLLGAFAAHRALRALPAVRRMAPDWVSWQRKDFPFGLALIATLWGYLAIVALTTG